MMWWWRRRLVVIANSREQFNPASSLIKVMHYTKAKFQWRGKRKNPNTV
jgi:hypothetical protein